MKTPKKDPEDSADCFVKTNQYKQDDKSHMYLRIAVKANHHNDCERKIFSERESG